MKNWMKISLLLCTFGFFRELRPSEPFMTDFLSGEWRNITADQINKDVYPWATYSYLSQLIIAFLITDMLRYKPLIVVSACVGIVIWSQMLWTTSLEALQTMEVFYGTYMATEVAFYTYIYAAVERDKFQKVTGFIRSSVLCARFLSGLIAQLLVSFGWMNLRELNYISFGGQIASLIMAILLPSIGKSIYFNSLPMKVDEIDEVKGKQMNTTKQVKMGFMLKFNKAFALLWQQFKESYSNPTVIQWSLWWALASCGFLQVQLYIQFLWQQINPTHENVYNGAVEAALTLLGAAGAFAAGFLNSKKFNQWDLFILTACAAVEGGVLLWGTWTSSVWVSYIAYVIFGTIHHFMFTVTNVNVAKQLSDDSFALIFGINTMLALVFQSLLTVTVISEAGLGLGPIDQFAVYSFFFFVLAIVYGIFSIVSSFNGKKQSNETFVVNQ